MYLNQHVFFGGFQEESIFVHMYRDVHNISQEFLVPRCDF